jgi:hypothetical protein
MGRDAGFIAARTHPCFLRSNASAPETLVRATLVPADNKWLTPIVVAAIIMDALASLNQHYPNVSAASA